MPFAFAPFRAATACVLAALLSCCARSHEPEVKGIDVAAQVDARVAAFLRQTHVPGLSVAVVRGGRDTLVFRGYGLADVANHVPATPATIYPIASVTKQFTAAAVMQLAEEGRLALDDSAGRYLPELPDEWRRVRIGQLLNHTSGVPAHPVLLPDDLAPDSVVALAAKEPFEFAPGTQWSYSNIGYLVLGLLIERVSGQAYAAYLESRIFRPHGMAATHYCGTKPHTRRRAVGYTLRDTSVVIAPASSMQAVFASGALCSTVGDMAAWNRALALGRVVGLASWARMTTPQGVPGTGDYGYGLIVQSIEGHRVVGHGGELEGFRASNAYLPDDSLSVTVLTNLGSESATELLLDIVRIALTATRPPGPLEEHASAPGQAVAP